MSHRRVTLSTVDDSTMWAGIVGFGMPAVIALLNQCRWDSRIKAVVAFGACLLAALGTVWAQGDVDVRNWVRTSMIVFVAAIGTYHVWWKPSNIAPTIEAATSAGRHRAD